MFESQAGVTSTGGYYHSPSHYQPQNQVQGANSQDFRRQNTPMKRSKRRLSDDENFSKKNRFQDMNATSATTPVKSTEEYPKFHHPDGGFIQFTPNGTIRTIIRDNVEISELQDPNQETKMNFKNVDHGIDGYRLMHNLSSPQNSVESYMLNGLRHPSSTSTHMPVFNDFYDCDSDLEEDCEMN